MSCESGSSSTSTSTLLIDLKYRLGSTLEKHLGDPGRRRSTNYREILLVDASERRRARGARGDARERRSARGGSRDPRGDLRGARAIGSGSSRRSRSSPRPRTNVTGGRVHAAAQDRARTAAENLKRSSRARSRRRRGPSRTIPSNAGTRDGARGARATRLGRVGSSLDVDLQRDRPGNQRRAASRANTGCASPRIQRAARQDRRGRRRTTRACSASIRPISEALAAMDALYRRTERLERSHQRVPPAHRARGTKGHDLRDALRADGRGLRAEARQARGRDRGVPRGAPTTSTRDEPRRALGARWALHAPVECGRSSPTTSSRSSGSPIEDRGADPPDAPARRAA